MAIRFRVQGIDRAGHRVARIVEARTRDEARQALREQGYSVTGVRPVMPWRQWAVAALAAGAAAGALAGLVYFPSYTVVGLVFVAIAAGVLYHRRQLQRASEAQRAERRATRRAALSEAQRRQALRKVEERIIDRTVEQIARELKQRRQEYEETMIEFEAFEPTNDGCSEVIELRQLLQKKQEELEQLQRELELAAAREQRSGTDAGATTVSRKHLLGTARDMSRLIHCPVCTRLVSNRATHCPQCGQPITLRR